MQRNEEGSSRSCCHANILELQQLWSNIGSIYINISTTNGSYNKQWYTYMRWVRDVLLVLLYVRQDASSFLGPMLLTMVNSNSNPFYSHVWTLIPVCICYFIHYKMWDEITYAGIKICPCNWKGTLVGYNGYNRHFYASQYWHWQQSYRMALQ